MAEFSHSSFTLVDSLHTITFLGIFGTLVVSAIALQESDKGNKSGADRINRVGARYIVGCYILSNIVMIILAIL